MEEHGIQLAFGETVKEVAGNGKVEKIITDKNEYDVDMVILAVGFRPNTAFAGEGIERFRNGAFLVNKRQETSIPGVYAIGDCATIYDNATGDTSYIALASNAVRTGIVAAHNICGTDLEGIGVQGSNGISIYGLNLVSTGLTLEKATRLGLNAAVTEVTDNQNQNSWSTATSLLLSRLFTIKIHVVSLVRKWLLVKTSHWVSTSSHWQSKKV